MFTGIITQVARLQHINENTVAIPCIDMPVKIGDSVSVNGVCLTIEEIKNEKLFFHCGPITKKTTNLGSTKYVNIEKSLQVGDSIGGHFVTGHIDTITRFLYKIQKERSHFLYFSLPKNAFAIIPKGSVTINGISLTIAEISLDTFSVQVIPHTFQKSNLHQLQPGDSINLEYDILAKYLRGIYEHTSH